VNIHKLSIILFVICASSCAILGSDASKKTNDEEFGPGDFWALRVNDSSWYRVHSNLVAEGTSCIVYAEKGSSIDEAMGTAIANEYDTNIHAQMLDAFGAIEDVDGNGKVILLLLDVKDSYSGGSDPYVGGYFQPDQMRDPATYQYSNGADMLYIDINPQTPNTPAFYATIAHELQHLINYSQTVARKPSAHSIKDTWINEGLSTAAEYIYAGDPNDRIKYVNYLYNNLLLGTSKDTVKDTFFVWENTLADYSTAYLFFQWLRIQAARLNPTVAGSTPYKIYKDILDEPGSNFSAVTNALNAFAPTAPPLTWAELVRAWFASNYYYTNTGDIVGYGGDATFRGLIDATISDVNAVIATQNPSLPSVTALISPFNSTAAQADRVNFRGGEGIIACVGTALTSASIMGTGSSIEYYSFETSGGVPQIISSYGAPDVLLIVNISNNNHPTASAAGIVPIGKPQASSSFRVTPGARTADPGFTPRFRSMVDVQF
jgi:hypothetical protein